MKCLLTDFYSTEDLSTAKDLLLTEAEVLKLDKLPKLLSQAVVTVLVNLGLDIDDILTLLTFLDESQMLKKLPTFTATSPDRMPTRLVEGDLSILWSKLTILEDFCKRIDTTGKMCSDHVKANTDTIKQLTAEVRELGRSRGLTACPTIGSNRPCPPSGVHVSKPPTVIHTVPAATTDFPLLSSATSRPVNQTRTEVHHSGPVIDPLVDISTIPTALQVNITWGSIASLDSESENDGSAFVDVQNRNTRRTDKRKFSPASEVNDASLQGGSKRLDMGSNKTVRNYSKAVERTGYTLINNGPNQKICKDLQGSSLLQNQGKRVVGVSTGGRLKAAERSPSPLSVFGISNVGSDYKVHDIRGQCADLGVNVRFCFDITPAYSNGRIFKLAVGQRHCDVIEDPNSWPAGVSIRPWKYKHSDRKMNDDDVEEYTDEQNFTKGLSVPRDNFALRVPVDQGNRHTVSLVQFLASACESSIPVTEGGTGTRVGMISQGGSSEDTMVEGTGLCSNLDGAELMVVREGVGDSGATGGGGGESSAANLEECVSIDQSAVNVI